MLRHGLDILHDLYERPSNFGDSPSECGFENVHYFYTWEEFQVIDGFCSREGLNVESRIYYEMHNEPDFLNYLDLLSNLETTKGTELKVYAKVEAYSLPKVRNNMNLTQPYNLMHRLFERLTRISINFEPLISTDEVLDLSIFANVEVLHLHNCNVQGSFASCRKLKELLFQPSKCFDLDLSELPLSLKTLALHSDHIRVTKKRKRKRKKSPRVQYPLIDRLCLLTYKWKCLAESAEVVLSTLVHKKMRSIEVNIPTEALYESGTCIEAIQKILIKKKVNLTSFIINGLDKNGHYSNSINEDLPDPQLWVPDAQILSTLQELVLHATSLTTTTPLLNYASTGLRYLSLSSSVCIDWAVSTKDFSKFTNLKQLDLKGCEIEDFVDKLVFPDSLESLDLSGNFIKSVDNAKFPNRLSNLNLSDNEIKSLTAPPFPKSLKSFSVHTGSMQECDLSVSSLGEKLQIKLLYLDSFGSNDKIIRRYKLPEILKLLSVQDTRCTFCSYPHTLTILYVAWCDFTGQDVLDLTCCPKLKHLDFTSCRFMSRELRLPDYLEDVSLVLTDFTEIPPAISRLEYLKELNIMKCFCETMTVNFLSTKLEVIDFSSCSIKKINLFFPGPTTLLRRLSLERNHLKDFTVEAMGHNNRCVHEKLQEIDLRSNKITEETISALKKELPISVKFLWVSIPWKDDVSNALCGNLFTKKSGMKNITGSCFSRGICYNETPFPPFFDLQ
ncbi:hypothetical protein I9W82_003679 [Candida metapsilosis]|uniref:Uncharacterized protein n=1 Tax=Candida metapsilosis TaxID=273372 RepID=A0A8H7ZFC4_9ASCO|nr:hypothetical protein I9W82_003679 [Candida metapsilosis]